MTSHVLHGKKVMGQQKTVLDAKGQHATHATDSLSGRPTLAANTLARIVISSAMTVFWAQQADETIFTPIWTYVCGSTSML